MSQQLVEYCEREIEWSYDDLIRSTRAASARNLTCSTTSELQQ